MFAIASFFFYVVFKGLIPAELGKEYLAGAVLLGAAPCTAMAFVPIVKFLLGVSKVTVPWDTLIISVVLFVVVPLTAGVLTEVPIRVQHKLGPTLSIKVKRRNRRKHDGAKFIK